MNIACAQGLTHAVAATTPDGFALASAMGADADVEVQQFKWFP